MGAISRWLSVCVAVAGSTVAGGCGGDDCRTVALAPCGFLAPAEARSDEDVTITVTYLVSGCVAPTRTTYQIDGLEIVVEGEGEVCCADCLCSRGTERGELTIPAGLAPGTYRIEAARGGEEGCDPVVDGPSTTELVIR